MKRISFISIVAVLSLIACTKEIKPQDTPEAISCVVITASFEANEDGTKTILDGYKPKWSAGDKIKFVDGPTLDAGEQELAEQPHSFICTLTSEDISSDGLSFSATLPTGWGDALYAVYPASSFDSITSDGKIRFSIPKVQDGSFGMANICVAKIDDLKVSTDISFKNATAIFNFSKFSYAATSISQISIRADLHRGSSAIAQFGADVYVSGTFEIATPGNDPTVVPGKGSRTVAAALPEDYVESTEYDHFVAVAPCALPYRSAIRFYDKNGFILGGKVQSLHLSPLRAYIVVERGTMKTFVGAGKHILGTDEDAVFKKYLFSTTGGEKVRIAPNNLRWSPDYSDNGGYLVPNDFTTNPSLRNVVDSLWVLSSPSDTTSKQTDKFYWTNKASKAHVLDYHDHGNESLFDAGSGLVGNWVVPTKLQWESLLNTSLSRIGVGMVKSIPGVIIVPDDFIDPQSNGENNPFVQYSTIRVFTANSYASQDWEPMMDAGAVFIPAAGFRNGASVNLAAGSSASVCNGYYWCRDKIENHPYVMSFEEAPYYVNFDVDSMAADYSYAIRLIQVEP